jgi:hypothetical protein
LQISSVSSTEATSKYFLNDAYGNARGTTIQLRGDDQKLLQMMEGAFRKAASRKGAFGGVQTYTQDILQCRLKSSGFSIHHDGFMFEGPFKHSMSDLEGRMSELIKQALRSIGYCSEEQHVQWYLSFLQTKKRNVQHPHIDFKWNDIIPPEKGQGGHSRSFRGNYHKWVPFIALFPLTETGMTIEIWKARKDHQSALDEKGMLVRIEQNMILLLRADVIHAGGFMNDRDCNPRAHLYIYQSDGVPHNVQVSNSYDVTIDGTNRDLDEFYKHNDQVLTAVETSIPDITITSEKVLLAIPNPVKKRLVQVPRKKLAPQLPVPSDEKNTTITSYQHSPHKDTPLLTDVKKETVTEELFPIGVNVCCTICGHNFGQDFADIPPKKTSASARAKRIARAFKKHAQKIHPDNAEYSFLPRKRQKTENKIASMSGLIWWSFQPGLKLLQTETKMSFDTEWKNVMIALAAGVGASLMMVKRNATVYFRGKFSALSSTALEAVSTEERDYLRENALTYLGSLLLDLQKADPVLLWNDTITTKRKNEFELFFLETNGPDKVPLLLENATSPLDYEQIFMNSSRKGYLKRVSHKQADKDWTSTSRLPTASGLVWYCLNHGYNLTQQYSDLHVTDDWHKMTLCWAACVGAALMDTKRGNREYFRCFNQSGDDGDAEPTGQAIITSNQKNMIVNEAVHFLRRLLNSIQLSDPNNEWEQATEQKRKEAFNNFFINKQEHKTTTLLKAKVQQIQDTTTEELSVKQFAEV